MKKKQNRKVTLPLKLTAELKKKLQERAAKEGESASHLARVAIARYLDNVPS